MEVRGQLCASATMLPGKRDRVTNWIGDWLGPRKPEKPKPPTGIEPQFLGRPVCNIYCTHLAILVPKIKGKEL
jgi:hypothetical protein